MTDHEIIEKLARAASAAEGVDPDHFEREYGPTGPYGRPYPWFSPDGVQKPWHKHVQAAQNFLTFSRAMGEAL